MKKISFSVIYFAFFLANLSFASDTQFYCVAGTSSVCAAVIGDEHFNTIDEGTFVLSVKTPHGEAAKNLIVKLWMLPSVDNDFGYKYDSGAAHHYSMAMGHGSAPLKIFGGSNNKFYIENAWFHTTGSWLLKVSFKIGKEVYNIDVPVHVELNRDNLSKVVRVNSQSESKVRTSVTGAKFVHDKTYPELGESAYRDPSGLIWGSVVVPSQPLSREFFGNVNARSKYMDSKQGYEYCKKIGAELPTEDNFLLLSNFLGAHTTLGYHPLQANGESVLPGGTDNYWTPIRFPGLFTHTIYFHGWFGELRGLSGSHTLGIRCVKQAP